MVVTQLLCGLDMILLLFHREFRLNSHASLGNKVVVPQKSDFVSFGHDIVRFSQQQKRKDRFWTNSFSLVYTWLKVT